MFPTLTVGSLTVPVYPLAWGLGIFVAGALAFHRMYQGGIPARHASRGILLTIWGGLLGAFLSRVLLSASQTAALTGEVQIHGGLSFLGVVIGGGAVGALHSRMNGVPLLRALDLGWLSVPLAQAIGRIGCVAAGCCYGEVTDGAFGLYLPDAYGTWANRYPTQLMALVANAVIFGMLLLLERRMNPPLTSHPPGKVKETRPFDGFLFLSYVLLFSIKRFALEFLRADQTPVYGPFTTTHALTGALIVGAGMILVIRGAQTMRASIPDHDGLSRDVGG